MYAVQNFVLLKWLVTVTAVLCYHTAYDYVTVSACVVKVKPMATPCHEAVDSCDLGEYCDGVSEFCPSDAYVADGTDCQTDEV